MRQYPEEENFAKLSNIILDIVPKYLRKCFIREWDKKYPDRQWQSNNANGEFLFEQLPENVKKKLSKKKKRDRLISGNEQKWDTFTLVLAILSSGLDFTDEVGVREAIQAIINTRKIYLEHSSSMSCPTNAFAKVMTNLRNAARILADNDSEKEIDEIENAHLDTKTTQHQMRKVQKEESRQRKLEDFLLGKIL